MKFEPIGHVIGGRVPAEDDEWGTVDAVIRLADHFGPDSVAGLVDFSHLEVVFHFDQVDESKIESGARRPRNNPNWPLIGVFAQRGKNRPNRIGVSRCQLVGVDGCDIHVRGLDATAAHRYSTSSRGSANSARWARHASRPGRPS